MGDYSKALEFYEKSHQIYKKALPPNHPSLAAPYSNIGHVYNGTSDYSKAFEFYENALKIREKVLPSNHSDLAAFYNSISQVYTNIGEYSKALKFYEKSHKILEKVLPPNHPDLATSYRNIGGVYFNTGDYSKALEFGEKSLAIFQKSFPPTHPHIQKSIENIEYVKKRIKYLFLFYIDDCIDTWSTRMTSASDFQRLHNALSTNLTKISTNVMDLEKLVQKLGTPEDSELLRERYHRLENETKILMQQTHDALEKLYNTRVTEVDQRRKKTLTDNLPKQYLAILNRFQKAQSIGAQKEKESLDRARAIPFRQHKILDSPFADDFVSTSYDQLQKQAVLPIEQEIDMRALREREEQLRELESSARCKKIILVTVLLIVIAIIVLVLVLTLKK
ncbi:unnamed protein product [Rotaria sordida]|uniref:Syntaxin N-terminal domain-containing protein n=1 Tax=Rotaria sordida TaxID=392033 RepID=A0A814K9G8_9BILA|nr:unnamed protein product [Rotaria sordida]CAF1207113.1 unnamed protein product [Rotaria sordida]